jgi:Raf kinase inhibitor-like YbhB/YbcL family protein
MVALVKRLILIVAIVLIVVAAALAVYNVYVMNSDASYHATLNKTIRVTSSDFRHQQEMPSEFSCHGIGMSPQIAWSGAPESVRSYAIVATDIDAPAPYLRLFPVVHWVVYNIPTLQRELPQNVGASDLELRGIRVARNVASQEAYAPPCPPLGQHRYVFRVYGLDLDEVQPASNNKTGVMAAIQGHVVAYGELIGLSSAR